MDWAALPIQHIPLNRIVFPCHDLDPGHVHEAQPTSEAGPIHVQQLIDGAYFVHNGRHRTLRARHRGDSTIPARIHA